MVPIFNTDQCKSSFDATGENQIVNIQSLAQSFLNNCLTQTPLEKYLPTMFFPGIIV